MGGSIEESLNVSNKECSNFDLKKMRKKESDNERKEESAHSLFFVCVTHKSKPKHLH